MPQRLASTPGAKRGIAEDDAKDCCPGTLVTACCCCWPVGVSPRLLGRCCKLWCRAKTWVWALADSAAPGLSWQFFSGRHMAQSVRLQSLKCVMIFLEAAQYGTRNR